EFDILSTVRPVDKTVLFLEHWRERRVSIVLWPGRNHSEICKSFREQLSSHHRETLHQIRSGLLIADSRLSLQEYWSRIQLFLYEHRGDTRSGFTVDDGPIDRRSSPV